MAGWITSEEFGRLVTQITEEGRELLANLEIEGNREKLPGILTEIRQRHDETAGKPKQRRPKVRPRALIEPGDMERFMRTIHQGDGITYRTGKPWGKPIKGTVQKKFPHIVLLESGATVMLFDIVKCAWGLYDDGWQPYGGRKDDRGKQDHHDAEH